jgi:hypothetical protein
MGGLRAKIPPFFGLFSVQKARSTPAFADDDFWA